MAAGRGEVTIEDGKFSLADYASSSTANADAIAAFRSSRPSRSQPNGGRGTWPASSSRAADLSRVALFTFMWHSVHAY